MNNLDLYVTEKSYKQWANQDWPSYEDFINGARPTNPAALEMCNKFLKICMDEGVKFPIKTATACQSKWTWSTIFLNTLSTASCHRVGSKPFSLEEFDDFHNTPKKLADRKQMLEGKWPVGGCDYCKNIEKAGGWSDRQHNLDIPNLTPPEVMLDPTAIRVTPRIVELFAQNTCNLSCIYCYPSLSSRIQQENKKFGAFSKNGVNIPVYNVPEATKEYYQKFKSWLERNIHVLVRLHLLGGETFLQHDLVKFVLEVIDENPNPNLELCIFTNMMAPEKFWIEYLDRIKELQRQGKIKVFDLTASLDAWGPQAEYVRYGLDLTLAEKRLEWASQQGDWMRLNVNQTVTSMTIKTMPELIERIDRYSKNKHIGHYFQFCTGQNSFQHPKYFSYNTWEKDFERIFDAMPKNDVHQQEAIPRMQGLQKQLQIYTEHDYKTINKLHTYLDEIDRRRGTDWRKLFPHLIV